MTVILGAGLAGLSASYHLKHNCQIFEKNSYSGGHIHSQKINEFTWDEGPHISFTKHAYVKELFASSVQQEFFEFPVYPTNYYKGSWVPHPAQTNLFALPEEVKSSCLQSFLNSREGLNKEIHPTNYKEWLYMAFGEHFAEEFPTAYTEKYWTTKPENLTTDWVGERVFYPEIEDVKAGYQNAPAVTKNYLNTVRYPKHGGYNAYADLLKEKSHINYQKEILKIDLKNKVILFKDGSSVNYTKLINTIPLPDFIHFTDAPEEIQQAANALSCSELLLINVTVNHPAPNINQWFYVYDRDKYSTRVSYTDLFSVHNGSPGKSGLQVEVYFSKYKKQHESLSQIIDKVCLELVEMGVVKSQADILEVNTKKVQYANVIFDFPRRSAMETIFSYLEGFGLEREHDEFEPMCDWNKKMDTPQKLGDLVLSGRFGQWKYFWTDDCVMRGLFIGQNL